MIHFEEPKKRHTRIEIIPMIDVMMFLLVFFVLISINVIPSTGIKTNLPSASASTKLPVNAPIIVTVAQDGTIQANGQSISVAAVSATIRNLSSGDKDPHVIIKTDGETAMQAVVSVMDELRNGGITKVSIATRPLGKS